MTAPLVIAEAGVNHNGDLERARRMVTAAAQAGADYVKFQGFDPTSLVAAGTPTAAYQARNTGTNDQVQLLRSLSLDLEALEQLAVTCREEGVRFLCTPFDPALAVPLLEVGMDRIKVASGELTNHPALTEFGALGVPVLVSTGMATLAEVGEAVAVLEAAGCADIVILHCTSIYPAPAETLNLRAIPTLARAFGRPVGYSDHSFGDHAAIAAVALGATVIEKHFTLDRGLPGPDHAASLEPDELAAMIVRLRETASGLGDGEKRPVAEEMATAALVRRSWHVARDLFRGHVLSASDLALKRPAAGLPPSVSPVGRVLATDLAKDSPVTEGVLA